MKSKETDNQARILMEDLAGVDMEELTGVNDKKPAPFEDQQESPQYGAGMNKHMREGLPATPRGATPCAHINLKISKELLAYLDVERFRFGMNRTELVNKILLAYAKENPHL